ncbi:hypothetical protein LX87_04764 [Larkinella arboricola]|uniref:Uncharacterized protein n=1 Tax=Larkinella arboricola TaxID=643671 RepID=A0A327WQY1_LARAB|nr:hypothetical protein [Larkinella arboricola]RAJ93252.1 hypothetical protein LX87_04764 [Larkinella arboricola]
MKNHVTIRLFRAFEQVNYYTFWVEDRPQSETDDFFTRFEHNQALSHDLNLLVTWLVEIGQRRGAKVRYFRFENNAQALPPPARIMAELGDDYCRLRLYGVRLSDQVVILANGGPKTSRTVQDSPELLAHFRFANKMATQILEMMLSGELTLKGKQINQIEAIELLD